MSQFPYPYFFDEATRVTKRPNERERALGISDADRDFLRNLFFSTDAGRRHQSPPMIAERLLISATGTAPIELAGAFMMSSTAAYAAAFLYTPEEGLEKFDNTAAVLAALDERLRSSTRRTSLVRFLSIQQRARFDFSALLPITSQVIAGNVFEEQKAAIDRHQALNTQAMLQELLTLPTLGAMLDQLLASTLRPVFPRLDASKTHVNIFTRYPPAEVPIQWLDSMSLRNALLWLYRNQAWPKGQRREFFNPGNKGEAQDPTPWENALHEAAHKLLPFMQSVLESFWNTAMDTGASRREFFTQAMSDKCRVDLLFKRQEQVLSAEQSQRLEVLYRTSAPERISPPHPLHAETVQMWEYRAHAIVLAGTLIIRNTQTYLYTQSLGLQVLKDDDDLQRTLLAMAKAPSYEDDFYNFLSQEERARFIGFTTPEFGSEPIQAGVFETLFNTIIEKQQHNLRYALEVYRRTQGDIDLNALVDQVLDIRRMFDHRLLALDSQGRWTTHPVSTTVPIERARLHIKTLASIEAPLRQAMLGSAGIEEIVSHELTRQLQAAHIAHTNPNAIFLNHYDSSAQELEARPPVASQTLVGFFLRRLIDQDPPLELTERAGLYGPPTAGQARRLAGIDLRLFRQVVETTLSYFRHINVAEVPREALEQLKPQLAHVMSTAILDEARTRKGQKSLSERDLEIVEAFFTAAPDGLNGFIPEAFSPTVYRNLQGEPLTLANCFLLTERGGLDPQHSGRAVCWSPARGLESFASVQEARTRLGQQLREPNRRLDLLENLAPQHYLAHDIYHPGPLRAINAPAAQSLQQSWIDHWLALRAKILSFKRPFSALAPLLYHLRLSPPATNLGHATDIAKLALARLSLPAWLGMAPPRELRRHAEIAEQYRLRLGDGKDYLNQIMPLRDFIEGKLRTLLQAYALRPDEVTITPKLALAGHPQNLLDFALNPVEQQASAFSVRCSDERLDEQTIRGWLQQLASQQDFQAQLLANLLPGKPGALEREALYIAQLPWQLLLHAHGLMLEERLSGAGFALVQQVLDMPDAKARTSVQGANAIIRPLELLATAGATLAQALNLYILSPPAGSVGPHLLYAPYSQGPLFTEFEHEAAFIEALNHPGAFQELILGRLPAPQNATYRHLLESTRGKTSEITLAHNPIQGHALKHLYQENTRHLTHMLARQADPQGASAWETVKQVFSSALRHGLGVISGKLTLPWVIWDSYQLFKASAQALQDHQWASALRTFIEGVGHMASIGELMDPTPPPPAAVAVEDAASSEPMPQAQTWGDIDMTAPYRTLLHTYEAHDVALTDLEFNAQSGVYIASDSRHSYVPIAGKVYRLQRAGEYWRILAGNKQGPFVCLDPAQQWVIDTRKHVPRFGQAMTRVLDRQLVRSAARSSINIEARGMGQIRQLNPERAQQIVEALDLATFYVQNCKLNLGLLESQHAPVTRIHRFINSFFGIASDPDTGPQVLDPALVQKLHRVVDLVLAEILSPSLYALDSSRFITGTHLLDPGSNWAFTIDRDPDRRIYLTENFFLPPLQDYTHRLTTPFNLECHARATALIHEVTHIACNTADVAYLETVLPFSDLIETLTQEGRDLQTYQRDIQNNRYSVHTPIGELFKFVDVSGNIWSDFGSTEDTEYIEEQILEATGGLDLSNARGIFKTNLAKRVDTMLDNADSLTLLITTLGRQLDAIPARRRPSIP